MTSEVMALPTTSTAEMRRWRFLMFVIFVIGVAWIYMSRLTTPDAAFALDSVLEAPLKGFLAPDFTLSDTAGKPIQLAAFKGRPVVINFWATWCPPCRREMPALEGIWREQQAKGKLMILGVDQGENAATVARFEAQIVDMTFPVLLDQQNSVSVLYQVRALPTTYFIDANGRIRDIKLGGMDAATMLDGISKIQD